MFDLTLPARTPLPQPPFLPTTRAEMDAIGWDSLDILLVTGDAYVDHPSFGVPLLGRWLVGHGYRVGIVAQPHWKDEGQGIANLARMGRPRLFAGVSAGALDSMLAHYTAFRKKRHDDAYTPGGEAGSRPNRAVIVYAGLIRKAFPGLPLLAGGIEASLRRITHYDFWADSLRRSILFDARLDILSCGMGERALLDVARRLDAVAELVGDLSVLEPVDGELWPDLWAGIPGTARLVKKEHPNSKVVFIGPCAAKKLEAMQDDIRTDVDFVLTYEELMGIFEAKEINFSTLPDSPDLDEGTRAGRGFAVAGGVAAAVEELIHKEHPDIELKTQRADGLRDCRKLLMLAKAGKLDGYLLEGMACPGGCVAGAGTVVSADTAAKKLAQHMAQASGSTAKDSKYRDLADQLN